MVNLVLAVSAPQYVSERTSNNKYVICSWVKAYSSKGSWADWMTQETLKHIFPSLK